MTLIQRPLPERRPLPTRRPLPPPSTADGVSRSVAANATLAGRYEVTGTLGIFVVVLDAPLAKFEPGQYVSLGVFDDAAGLVQRPYSIVSLDAGGKRLELFIRRLPDGRLSNLLWRQSLGARLRVGPPRGLFSLDAADQRPRLLVGTGTGVAPLLAMLDALAVERDRTPSIFVHGASFHAELAYRERIVGWLARGLDLDYRPTVSRPHDERNAGWRGLVGRAEAQVERLLTESPALARGGSVAYLCGNPDMIAAVSVVLGEAGFAEQDIRVEQFHPPVHAGR